MEGTYVFYFTIGGGKTKVVKTYKFGFWGVPEGLKMTKVPGFKREIANDLGISVDRIQFCGVSRSDEANWVC